MNIWIIDGYGLLIGKSMGKNCPKFPYKRIFGTVFRVRFFIIYTYWKLWYQNFCYIKIYVGENYERKSIKNYKKIWFNR